MTETIQGLQSDNEILHGQVTQLQRRVEECNEVIDAVKTQLVDYKTMLTLVRGARSLQPTHSRFSHAPHRLLLCPPTASEPDAAREGQEWRVGDTAQPVADKEHGGWTLERNRHGNKLQHGLAASGARRSVATECSESNVRHGQCWWARPQDCRQVPMMI